MYPIFGLAALLWFLIRVVPKPSRAAYPCQRVAAPLAGGFLSWLIGIVASITFFRKARHSLTGSRWRNLVFYFVLFLLSAVFTLITLPDTPIDASDNRVYSQPNSPLGTARGINPGRVVWVYDPDATDWAGYQSAQHWWDNNHTDLAVVEKMISRAIRGTSGASTDTLAWEAIFKYNNRMQGKGNVGYQSGEKIAIKLNMVTCIAKGGYVDPQTYDKDPSVSNRIDTSPHAVLALLRQLVNIAGVSQEDITVGDPTALFPNCYWNIIHPEFPNVKYWDNYGGSGRTRAEFSNVPFYWSTADADGKVADYLPKAVAEADYLIDFAVLKGHSAGVTLCGKNHYGTLIRCPDGHLRDEGILDYYNTHLSLPNSAWSPGLGNYRSIVDLMGHPQLGGKTLLYLIDGLFAGYYWDAQPRKWTSPPFGDGVNGDWPSSLLASLDPVAIDSVAYDFLLEEWPEVVATGGGPSLQGGAEDYLHEAAQADDPPSGTLYDPDNDHIAMSSLGVHEHWNNETDKMYSRNLGTGYGIELFRIYNLSGFTSKIAVNRSQLNFAYVMGGSSPTPQSLQITNAAAGESSWMVNEDLSWLDCTPASGNNSGTLTAAVNPSGLGAGKYTGTLTVTNLCSQDLPLEVQVNLFIYRAGTDSAPFGSFDTPAGQTTVRSSIAVTGWVLDDVAVDSVKIYRLSGNSLVYIGDATLVEGARPDVEAAYPTYPFNYKAGWGYMMLTNFLPDGGNGTFVLHAQAVDSSGHQITLGTKTIYCDNAHAEKPFGAIDSPAQGGTASGNSFINWGWALTPQPNNIPKDGSTIKVWVDGVNLGNPVYDKYRSDIAELFPGYANSDGAAGFFYLDTSQYSDGVHTIQWTVTDSAGNADGIGSRYFNIRNTANRQQTNSTTATQYMNIPRIPRNRYLQQTPKLALTPYRPSNTLQVRKGFENKESQTQIIYSKRNGNFMINIEPLDRIEIQLPTGHHWHGYQKMGENLRNLPTGSHLDTLNGVFTWQPGPGFKGEFHLLFLAVPADNKFRKKVIINISPHTQ